MEHVRIPDPPDPLCPPEVTLFIQAGEVWVIRRSGGVSCFDAAQGGNREWRLPQGEPYPDELFLRRDPGDPTHWTWEPDTDMKLADYKALLSAVGLKFLPV
jgi:hypothetical protein